MVCLFCLEAGFLLFILFFHVKSVIPSIFFINTDKFHAYIMEALLKQVLQWMQTTKYSFL